MEKYEKIKVVGKGSFGAAWLVRRRGDGKQLIAKEIQVGGMKPREKEEARNEVKLLSQLRHPNITQYHDSFEHTYSLFIVMEFADGGDMSGKIRSQKGIRMKESTVMHYFTQICLALNYLHERHILHRDLKCQNVFLTSNGVVKLGDFGIATVLRNTMALAHTVCGTPYYFSPELCQNKPYNNKSDIWALGCVLYEVTTLQHAFEGQNMKILMQKIIKGVYPPISREYSSNLRTLISRMLSRETRDRPSINTILQIPYVEGYICTLSKILGQGISEKKSMVTDEVKTAARIEAQGRINARHEQDERQAKAEMLDHMNREKHRADSRDLEGRMEKMRLEQKARLRENHRKEIELERHRLDRLREIEKREEVEKEKRRYQREEELEKWRERKRVEAKEDAIREERRRVENARKEQRWNEQMKEMAADEQRRREARDRESEERVKAAGKAYWEMRNAAEQNKKRLEKARVEEAQADLPVQADVGTPHREKKERKMSEQQLHQMHRDAYLDMKREAARNKARLLDGGGSDDANYVAEKKNSPPAHHQSPQREKPPVSPQRERPPVSPQRERPPVSPVREKHSPEPSDEERKQAYLEMRREAKRNKARLEADLRGEADSSPATPEPSNPSQTPKDLSPKSNPPSRPVSAPRSEPRERQQVERPPERQNSPFDKVLVKECQEEDNIDLDQWVNCEVIASQELADEEWEGDYKGIVEHIEAIRCDVKGSFRAEEEFCDANQGEDEFSMSKFVLDGRTFNLPNVKASDPLMYRIEALRMFLSEELGESNFVVVYRKLDSISEDDSEIVMQEVKDILNEKTPMLQLVTQLIFCEDQFNVQQNKPP